MSHPPILPILMDTAAPRNRVRQALEAGRFLMSVEFASPHTDLAFDDAVRPALDLARAIRNDPRIDAVALTDRSRSDDDHDPIAIGHRVADACGSMPIVHLAGKDRSLRVRWPGVRSQPDLPPLQATRAAGRSGRGTHPSRAG